MNIQLFIVLIIIAAAVAYAALSVINKRKAFSPKGGCGSDCGCGTNEKAK